MMSEAYDTTLRRDTPLARKLIARIKASGPISVSDYMDACLNDPEHGYYRTQRAIGRSGDFITAPEISQIFGELIGLWCAVVWQQMGSPKRVNLVELGAGRGALLADALRAVRVVPSFRAALSLHILDANPALMAQQRTALADCGVPVTWHERLETLPSDVASIWVANEFLDTLPVAQAVALTDGDQTSRSVALDADGRLAFVYPDRAVVCEAQDFRAIAGALKARVKLPLAALFVDYGYRGAGSNDTLQAVRGHRFEHVLASPGEADLSVQVAFDAFAAVTDLATDGPTTQAEFLGRLGVMERASKLMAANPAKANALEMGVARLMHPSGMGTRFMVLGLRSPSLPPLPGLPVAGLRD
jgi:NADH dehydrogenase [ubiquinone] 1 alpha subcomplex assembly factor 7